MWGIVPAAGIGSRIQPLAFSKELLPVGSRLDDGVERPCAVSEYLVERMIRGGADKICFVISPGKSDILEYYGAGYRRAPRSPMWCSRSRADCATRSSALPAHPDRRAGDGRPARHDLVSRGRALRSCRTTGSPSCFSRSTQPEFFDAVVLDDDGRVREIQVKRPDAASHWIWGAFKMPGRVLEELRRLWRARDATDEYIGTLVNACLAAGGEAVGVQGRQRLCRCRHAARLSRGDRLLGEAAEQESAAGARVALGWPGGQRRKVCTT